MVILYMRRVLEDLSLRPFSDTDEEASQAPLPPPMLRVSLAAVAATVTLLRFIRSSCCGRGRRLGWCLAAGGPSPGSACRAGAAQRWRRAALTATPAGALQNNWPNINNSCLVGKLFGEHVVASRGFKWMNDGTKEKPKWGW